MRCWRSTTRSRDRDAEAGGSARARSGAAEGLVPDSRRALVGHRAGAVLLDVHEPDGLGRAHVRRWSSSATSTPICATSSRSSTRSRWSGWRAGSTTCCRTSRRSTSRLQVVHAQPVPFGYIGFSVGYGAVSIVGMLLAARDADLLAPRLQMTAPCHEPRPERVFATLDSWACSRRRRCSCR